MRVLLYSRSNCFNNLIECIVVPKRVVMGQREALYMGALAEPDGVFGGAMTPADLGWIFRGGVLCIVNEKVCTLDKFRVR